MSGSAMLNPSCRNINVASTSNLLDLCVEFGVSKFVHTSTYNVVFGGQEIRNGDESMKYFPVNQHTDFYSQSKCESEDLAMKANGRVVTGGISLTLILVLLPYHTTGQESSCWFAVSAPQLFMVLMNSAIFLVSLV